MSSRTGNWSDLASKFLDTLLAPDGHGYASVQGGPTTLYGTSYALMAKHYLGETVAVTESIRRFVANCQAESGEFIGPELQDFEPAPGATHSREHLTHHLTCTAVPTCLEFRIPIRYPLTFAHRYLDLEYLHTWLGKRELRNAWLEGNNLLFVGQLLVYLRDVEKLPVAESARQIWFDWLDANMDPSTSLWGSNGYCSRREAVYGGYHQLLVYYHEDHAIPNPAGLVDTALSLQHYDGSFHPHGNGGACEDVDCVDILVNMYKRHDYRRRDIRVALRRCLRHILALQNADGGFPYNRDQQQSHMGIPGTSAPPNASTAFATWFRVHTLALIAQVLPHEPCFRGINFRFSSNISMGWHRARTNAQIHAPLSTLHSVEDAVTELPIELRHHLLQSQASTRQIYYSGRRQLGAALRRFGLR